MLPPARQRKNLELERKTMRYEVATTRWHIDPLSALSLPFKMAPRA